MDQHPSLLTQRRREHGDTERKCAYFTRAEKQRCFYQVVKERLPRLELSLPRERRVGLYTMLFENPIKCGQLIQKTAAQGVGAVGLATIFEKMELFRPFYRAGVAIEIWRVQHRVAVRGNISVTLIVR